MSVISEWIRSLIFILILAGIVEMLIPRGSMHRFVQVVLGLMIIMLLLQPLLGLLSRQTFFERRLAAISWEVGRSGDAAAIIARSEDLAGRNGRFVADEFRRQAAAQSEAYALTVDGVAAAAAEVEAVINNVSGRQRPEINLLRLRIETGEAADGAPGVAVDSVRAVMVGPATDAGQAEAVLPAAGVTEAEKERIHAELLRTFHNFYGLSPEKIIIEIN
ncbi:MAG: stage III sporulation protein AF [bacterium]